MKVIFVNQSFDNSFGGPAFSVPLLAKGLVNFGITPVFLDTISGSSGRNQIIEENDFPWFRAPCVGPDVLKLAPEMLKMLRTQTADGDCLVHINNPWNYVPYSVYAACKESSTPYIHSARGSFFPWSLAQGKLRKKVAWALFQRQMLEDASFIHATSEEEADSLRDLGIKNDIVVIPNPVEIINEGELMSKRAARMALGWEEDSKYLLFFSRIHPKKGLEYVISAMKKLKSENLKLKIAGGIDDVSYWKKLTQLIEECGLQERIEYVGLVPGDKKRFYFSACDVFVLTSHTENFGMSIAEAMSFARPVLISPEVPWHDTENLGAGWIAPLDISAVAAALKEISKADSQTLDQMGFAARSYVSQYEYKKVAAQMAQIIR